MISAKKLVTIVVLLLSVYESVYAVTRHCNGIWKPSPGMSWMWQIYNTPTKADIVASGAQAIDIDMWNTPTDLIDYIHSLNKTVICYIDTAYEPDRSDSSLITASLRGSEIDGWPGQHWVDIRSSVIRNVMLSRAKTAKSKGCDAIEWDDVDAYANDNGLGLKASDQITFNKFLADMTHSLAMSVGLKNDLDQVVQLQPYFDWALNEECVANNECNLLLPFIKAGKAVFGTEYQGSAAAFCPTQNALNMSWLYSDLDLNGNGVVQCCKSKNPKNSTCEWVSETCAPATAKEFSEEAPSSAITSASISMVLILACILAFFA